MFVATAADFKKGLKAYLDKVGENFETLIIHRGKRGKDVVVISLEEYNALSETNYLLSNPTNAQRLLTSVEQHRNGKAARKKLIEE